MSSASFDIRDTLTPALRRKLEKVRDKGPLLSAGAEAFKSLGEEAFRDESARPAPWAPLAPATLKAKGDRGNLLINTGMLWRSLVALPPSGNQVEIGTDRQYAAFHQYGTKRMPARPFLPYIDGNFTERAERQIGDAIAARLNGMMK